MSSWSAAAILEGTRYDLDDVTGGSLGGGWLSRAMDWAVTRGASGGNGVKDPATG